MLIKISQIYDIALAEENYRDTLVVGAMRNNLSEEYINYLKSLPVISQLKYKLNEKDKNMIFKQKEFVMNDIKKSEDLFVLKGVVLSVKQSKFLNFQKLVVGRDITLVSARRWAFSTNKNCKNIASLEEKQKEYINHSLLDLMRNNLWGVKCVGTLKQTEKNCFESYAW